MAGNGARKLIFVRPDNIWPAIEERESGVRAALERWSDLEVVTLAETRFPEMVAGLETRLRDGPEVDAIIGGNDQFGIAALHAASQAGIRVPEDLLVSGFNGFGLRAYSTPLLTSPRSPAYDMGEAAAESPLNRLEGSRFARLPALEVTYLPGETIAPLPE